MIHTSTGAPKDGADDSLSKLVGALLLELVNELPDKPGFESVRTDLLAASKVYESGKKTDLVLRFYLAIRSLLEEVQRLENVSAGHHAAQNTSGHDLQPLHQPNIGTAYSVGAPT
jgi:hypothetical protein